MNKVVINGDASLENIAKGQTRIDTETKGDQDLEQRVDGDLDLLSNSDGDLNLRTDIQGEAGIVYTTGISSINWGDIGGNLPDQEDLQEALDSKADTSDIPTLTSQLTNDSGFIAEWVHDMGEISMEEYDWDFWEYLNQITESGFYKVHDTMDDFDYFAIVERIGDSIYQEYWYTEESGMYRYFRTGTFYDDEWEYYNYDSWISWGQAIDQFAYKNHTHYIEETVNYSNILTYLNTFNLNKTSGSYKITNTYNRSVYYVEYDVRYVDGLAGNYRFMQSYYTNADSKIYIRFGTRNGNNVVWGSWNVYMTENDIYGNFYDMDAIDEMFSHFSPTGTNMIPILWEELVELRDNGELTAGAYYRITDYNFVTGKTNVVSGNHQFDIVVLAVSESMLSENAYAVKNNNDTYFEREVTVGGIEWLYTAYADWMADTYGEEPQDHADDLHAADIFCDSGYMEHPETGDTVPVLFKTNSEEYGIDDPDYDDVFFYAGTYDFDGDEYDMWEKWEHDWNGDWQNLYTYALTPICIEDGEFITSPIPETKNVPVNMNAWELKYCLDNDKALFDWADTNGKGVIYYMKDEYGNEAPYDFKNVQFKRYTVSAVTNNYTPISSAVLGYQEALDGMYYLTVNSNYKLWYTFNEPYNSTTSDGSLFGMCQYNSIQPRFVDGKRWLNDIVVSGSNNTFGLNCYNISLLNANDSIFGTTCRSIYYKGGNSANIDDGANNLTMFGCGNAQIGKNSNQIVTGSNDGLITGRACSRLRLGTSGMAQKFGTGCVNIALGDYCYGLTFGDSCQSISAGNYFQYSTFEQQCTGINISTNYVRYLKFEQYVRNITLNYAGTGSFNNNVQFYEFQMGMNNYSFTPTRNLQVKTSFRKNGSVVNDV